MLCRPGLELGCEGREPVFLHQSPIYEHRKDTPRSDLERIPRRWPGDQREQMLTRAGKQRKEAGAGIELLTVTTPCGSGAAVCFCLEAILKKLHTQFRDGPTWLPLLTQVGSGMYPWTNCVTCPKVVFWNRHKST